jgi:predicted RNA-binding Zn-ribbon protein involved in translation (DUF1610 family)
MQMKKGNADGFPCPWCGRVLFSRGKGASRRIRKHKERCPRRPERPPERQTQR